MTGCGDSTSNVYTGAGPAPVANAYRFVPLASSGQTLPNNSAILAQAASDDLPFMGGVMLNDRRHVCFHITDQLGRHGVYEVDYEAGGQTTSPLKHIISEGDVLSDGTVVEDMSSGYLNNDDDLVFVVTSEAGETMQYSNNGGPLERFFDEYDDVSPECRLYGYLRPEVGLTDSGDVIFVSGYRDPDDRAVGDGLFLTPNEDPSQTVLLLSEGHLLPGSSAVIRSFGLCEIGEGGDYLIQGTAALVETDESTTADGSPLSFLLHGRPGETPEVLVAHPALGITGAIQGSMDMGPRMGASGFAFIVSLEDSRSQLYLNSSKLLDAGSGDFGSLTPRGQRIISMFPPAFGPNGQLLLQVFTDVGAELLAYDGQSFSSILATGDVVDGKQVAMFLFGALPHCVNTYGEFATALEYADGESVILLGIPV